MTSLRCVTRRAVPTAFLLFAAALFVVRPAEASRTTTDLRSIVAPSLELPSTSHELASRELLPSMSADPAESSPRFGFAEDLGLLDPEAEPCGFVLFAVEPSRCELTYARNNPLKYVDPDGRDAVLYIRHSGSGINNFGHVALRVFGKGYDRTYDFGRYGQTTPIGRFKPTGEGILKVWANHKKFEAKQRSAGDLK